MMKNKTSILDKSFRSILQDFKRKTFIFFGVMTAVSCIMAIVSVLIAVVTIGFIKKKIRKV